jgi:multidomain signaling protein FimX
MSPVNDTLYLLIHTESQNDAEAIVSLLRSSGNATRAHAFTSIEEFTEQLQQKTWDLVISEIEAHGVPYQDLLQQVQRLNKDIPMILLNHEIDLMLMEDALKKGVATVVPKDESNLLVLAIEREMRHLRHRREMRAMEIRVRDAEKRSQSMLESSREAISYIHDGMHIFANSAYLNLFGYESVAELEGMPIMDMVDSNGQSDFKNFLKAYNSSNQQTDELNTIGVDGEGNPFPMHMVFARATYSDERCIQVSIKAASKNNELEARLREMSNIDVMTGLFNKPYFMAQLEKSVDKAVLAGETGAILYINVDHFGKVKSEVGISHADSVLLELASSLKKRISSEHVLSRISEDIFSCIFMGISADQAVGTAQSLRQHIENLLIDLGDRTVSVTTSIGIALINDTSSRPEDVLQQAHYASDGVRKLEGHEQGNGVMLYVPPAQNKSKVSDTSMEEMLTEALRKNGFRLMFQPLISLRGSDSEHYEALLRLPGANGVEISAGEFMNRPDVSDALKRKIDRWVILNTVKLVGEHHQNGHNTRVFINLTAQSILDESLPGWIGVALRAARLPRGSVIAQFSEDDASRLLKQAQHFSESLAEKGIHCSMNRFGCALNPFRNLKHLTLEYIKLDGSYTREMSDTPENQKQLKEMLAELHEANKQTIIPQVESASALASLWQLGVHFIQGYYVQVPQESMSYNFEEESSF